MPPVGVSVPRGQTHRGDRRSEDLELEIPVGRALPAPRAAASPRATAPEHDPYDLSLDLHVDFDLGRGRPKRAPASRREPASTRAAARREPASARAAARREPASRAAVREPERVRAVVRREPAIERPAVPPEPPRVSASIPERRTVIIQGHPSDRYLPPAGSRRRQPPPHYRAGFQPDRVAMWAVFLGVVLLLVAATSSHAAVLGAHALATLAH